MLRLRTNYRGEQVRLYRLRVQLDTARRMLLDYVREINELAVTPKWYNAALHNCTTAIRYHTENIAADNPWDWRILLPGKVDELLYAYDGFETTLPLAEYKAKSHINPVATGIGRVDDYSRQVRKRVPAYLD